MKNNIMGQLFPKTLSCVDACAAMTDEPHARAGLFLFGLQTIGWSSLSWYISIFLFLI